MAVNIELIHKFFEVLEYKAEILEKLYLESIGSGF